MAQLPSLIARVVGLFRRRALDTRVDEEMLFHLEMQIEENIRRGMTPQEARRQAYIASGGLEQAKELHRDARGLPFIDGLFQDVRHAVRRFRQSPGFTVVAVLTLALGLSVNATIFGIISSIFLRPLPVKDADRLVLVVQQYGNRDLRSGMAWSDYRDYQEQISEFSDVLALNFRPANLNVQGHSPDRTWIEAVSGNYFSMLGVTPLAGRFFLPGEVEQPNADPIAILSYEYWQTHLGGDLGVIGQTIVVNGHPLTLIGIAPQEFSSVQFALAPSLFVPATMTPELYADASILERRNSGAFKVLALLRRRVSVSQASAAVQALGRRLAEEYRPDSEVQVFVQPERLTRPEPSVSRFLPFAAAVFAVLACLVLFISCANVANLMFARNAARQNEISTRRALGAKRSRLIRQLLTESALLAVMAAIVGMLLSYGTGILLARLTASTTGDIPLRPDQRWDWLPVAATFVVSILAGGITGLFPALRATRGDLVPAIKGGTAGVGRERQLFRSGLVLGQVAMSVTVLASGALFVRSLIEFSSTDLGFRSDRLLMASVDLDLQGYSREQGLQAFERWVDQAKALPGVESAAIAATIPFDNYMMTRIVARDGPAGAKDATMQIGLNPVDPSYLDALGVTLLAGRAIAKQDDRSSPPVAVVNETFAQRLWPNQDPVGKSFHWQSGGEPVEVIGVARNGKYQLLGEAPRPFAYLPIAQQYSGMATLHLRSTAKNPLALAPAVRELISGLDPDLPVFNVRTMDEHMRSSVFGFLPLRIGALLAGAQGLLALFLAVLGVYGVVASSIAHKTRDIGIRIAMGAQKSDVFGVVARSGLRPALIGLTLGIIMSFALARLLRALLYGLDPLSVPMFSAVFVLVLAVALFACWLPARRALRMDPMVALRHE